MKSGHFFALGLVAALAPSGAYPSPLCAGIKASMRSDQIPAIAANAGCTTSLDLSGARSLNCHWRFDYRAEAAREAFEHLREQLLTCVGSGAVSPSERGVNHPDTYTLWKFRIGEGEVGLSLKDKAALQETLVFLRITPHG